MILKKVNDLDKLTNCAANLESLGPDTEKEFLNIGNTLHNLADSCFTMTDEALKLTALSSFRLEKETTAESSFVEETRTIFNQVADQVQTTIHSLHEGDHLLVDILTEVQKLTQPVQELAGIGKTFKVLGISIKVESSRNENARHGFQLLAEEVASIAELVHDNCQYCTEKTDRVAQDITASRQVLGSSENQYDTGGEQAIANILDTLEEIGGNSETLAMELKERSTVMAQGIGEVVMAMQFHDIARQQLENVAAALEEAREKGQASGNEASDATDEQAAMEVYGILSIQAAHLNSIYEQILHAKQQIEGGLQMSMEQALLQARGAGTLLEMDDSSGKQSVVGSLEQEIENIVGALNNSLAVVKDAAKVSKGVYENVSEIEKFVNKIEEIAFDVKILAINAMVEAIKTGDTGRTLTVLAKELSNLSQETRTGASDSIAMLGSIMQHTEKQVEFSTTLDQNRAVIDTMIENAKTLTATILTAMQEVSALAKKIERDSQDLSSRITRLIPGITFPLVMGDRIEHNWNLICGLIDQIEEEYPQFTEKNPEVEQMLEQLSNKYVMDRERSIHAQVAGGVTGEDTDTGEIDLFGGDDDFELFDDDPNREAGDNTNGIPRKKEQEFDDNVELF